MRQLPWPDLLARIAWDVKNNYLKMAVDSADEVSLDPSFRAVVGLACG